MVPEQCSDTVRDGLSSADSNRGRRGKGLSRGPRRTVRDRYDSYTEGVPEDG